jgi:hypothetical protein
MFSLFWGLVWGAVVVLSIIGGLSGYFYLLPRLQIDPASGYERVNDPLEVALSLTNNGYLPIHPDKVACYVYLWRTNTGNNVAGIAYDYLGGGTLARGETVEFIPNPLVTTQNKVISADFLIIVTYHQRLWYFPLEKRIRFKAERGKDDLWRWYRPFLSEVDRKGEPVTHAIRKRDENLDNRR